jgi:hypothetical protein
MAGLSEPPTSTFEGLDLKYRIPTVITIMTTATTASLLIDLFIIVPLILCSRLYLDFRFSKHLRAVYLIFRTIDCHYYDDRRIYFDINKIVFPEDFVWNLQKEKAEYQRSPAFVINIV